MIKKNKWLVLLAIVLLGSVLRTPITGIGAIIGIVKENLHINNTLAGLITTIPLVAFALISPFASKYSNKYGLEKTLFYSTIIITVGLLLRFYINVYVLFITTFIIGVGIALGNVLLPAVVKKYYPTKLGIMTGFFSVIMTVTASISAAVSYPIASSNIFGETFSLGLALNIWVIVAFCCVVVYYCMSKNNSVSTGKVTNFEKTNIFRSPKLYTLTMSMGLQSALYYSSVSWFGQIMIDKGFFNAEAGLLLSVSQFAQFPATFLMPILADKVKNKLIIPLFIVLSYFISLVGLLYINTNMAIMVVIMILFALAGGGSFSYVMYLFSVKTRNADEASKVSGVAQSGGYVLAAIFPPLLGYVKDVSNWNSAMYILVMAAVVLFFAMIHCSREGNIIEN
ncbi:MFS transporter [Gemella sp. GH3]|uniref:MFS transporter n=1 Tax=unclassified Gemella TaxID=2624949 RepID=UPI0015D05ACF|nr:MULTISPECIES: MFS transporter [unclassified Gemella]MBF0714250.1 MFS transporter [Gemella sp. GH3.1]NYS51202.1 MFS transporter [Gemella sp. GH3]